MNKAMLFLGKLTAKKQRNKHNIDQTESKSVQHTLKYLEPYQEVLNIGYNAYKNKSKIIEHVKGFDELNHAEFETNYNEHKTQKRAIETSSFDATTLSEQPFEDQMFDVVTAFHVLQSIDDIEAAIHHINTLLKPGGLMIVSTTCLGEQRSFRESILAISDRTDMGQKTKVFSIAELENWVTGGNFEIVETRILSQANNDYFLVAQKQ